VVSSGGGAARNASRATSIQQQLMGQYGRAGVGIVQPTQAYIRGALDQGEPGYVGAAYDAARTGAGEGALQAQRGLLAQLGGRSGGGLLSGLVGATAAGGRAFTEERAGVGASQAMNTVSQRNNLLRLLSGQGAQMTQLNQGFGRLGMQAIGQQAEGGDPFYEGVIGLGSAGAAGYLNWLSNSNRGTSTGMVNQTSGSYQRLGTGWGGGGGL
jgi:hypothetical protein